MDPSSEKSEKRRFFDVHFSPKKRRFFSVFHTHTVNLKPRWMKRHKWAATACILVIVGAGFFGLERLFIRAEVADFYPSACLGSWSNVQNAQGEPAKLSTSSTTFNETNSATYAGGESQIFCGSFVPPNSELSGSIKNVGLTLVWQIGEEVPSSTIEVIPPSEELQATTTPTSTPEVATSTPTSFLRIFKNIFSIARADDASTTPNPVTSTQTTDTATTTAVAPTITATTTTSTVEVPLVTTTPIVSEPASDSIPAGTIWARPVGSESVSTGTISPGSALASTNTTPTVIAPTPPDNSFLKISYSTDGQNWIEIKRVDPTNWQNLTISLPINSWDELKKMQISIEGIPTALAQIPKVFLDGMFMEVHYDLPPVILGNSNSGTNQSASGNMVQVPVITLPPDQKPVPSGSDSDFRADETPKFNLDLKNLPVPLAPPPATTPDPGSPSSFKTSKNHFSLLKFRTENTSGAWLNFFLGFFNFGTQVNAQNVPSDLPTAQNPIVAKILDVSYNPTNFEPIVALSNSQLSVGVPEPRNGFRPGLYHLRIWYFKDNVIYFTESDFTWGVLAVNFNKSVYKAGDTVHAGFGVLDNNGHTLCDANVDMTITSPSGNINYFSTQDRTIKRNSTCGPTTVTNTPDYSATFHPGEIGKYSVSVTAGYAMGMRKTDDSFEVQPQPIFDVERSGPTRIYPPATYGVLFNIKASAAYKGTITETVPASFDVVIPPFAQKSISGDMQTISWGVDLAKGSESQISYSFKAPNISPELYKLGPLQFGNTWQESRVWQVAADAISDKVIFLTGTASTTWTVPNDFNNASNTIEVIAGGGGGAVEGTSNRGGPGGGGGAYAKIKNWSSSTVGSAVKIQVGTGGGSGASGTVSFFSQSGAGATSTCSGSTMSVCATFGGPGVATITAGVGGASSTSIGSTTHKGGNGGAGSSSSSGGAGGGGAAGKNGDGNVGQAATGVGGLGGSGDAGSGGAGGATSTTPGGTGGAGTEWTSNPGGASGGSGGGGGGALSNPGTGGTGGNYGGGGGGARGVSANTGGVGTQGIIVIIYTPVTISIADGTQAAGGTIGPGAAATTSAVFTLKTNFGTSTITGVTTTVSTSSGIFQIKITDSAGSTVYGSSTNPSSNTNFINTSGTSMNVSTTATTFNIVISPLSATNMPAVPGATYTVTSTLTAWSDSKSLSTDGVNTTSSVLKIDNASPADVTGTSGTPGNTQVTLNWTNPGDADFHSTVVLRATSSITVVPVEGTTYTVGNTINATTTVACVVASSTANCTDSSLTNGTAYSYKIFSRDNFANYAAGVVPTGSPFTPSTSSPPVVSKVKLNSDQNLVLTANATTTFSVVASSTDTGNDISFATGTIYRAGLGNNCAASNLNCYQIASSSCSFKDSTNTVTCSADVWYFAQATDASSSFSSDSWKGAITVTDAGASANASTSASSTQGVLTLLSINVTTSSVNYGAVNPNANTGATNQSTTVQNTGNASTTLKISGSAMTLGSNILATSSQHYATGTFTFGGSEQTLSDVSTAVSGFLLTVSTTTNAVSSPIYWGISITAGTATGTYSGTDTLTAVFST